MTDFLIRIKVDPGEAIPGTRRVRRELDTTTLAADRLRRALLGALGALGIGAGLAAGVRTLASFSQEMATVAAVSEATEVQFARLEERAISLGESTRFTATNAAEGMVLLAQAGFTANETFETIDDTLNLAQAGALGLAEAADISSSALRGFRLGTDQAGRVVDVLALAANKSNTTVGQLGEALKFVAPIAAGVGVEIEETAAAIAALSNAGLQASLAGTGLRRVISELESPSTKTAKILDGLQVSTDEVRVSQVGLTAALQRLRDAGLDTGQALEVFGDRGGPAFEVLASALPEVRSLTAELDNAGGTAARVAAIMDDNLNGSLLAVQSAFEGLVLRLGKAGAAGALRDFFGVLTDVLRAAAKDIDTFISVVQSLAFALSVELARRAIPILISAVNRLTLAIAANPFGAMAVAVTLVTAAVVGFADQIEISEGKVTTLEDVFAASFSVMGEMATALGDQIEVVFQAISDSLGGVFGEIEVSVEGILRVAATVADRTLGLLKGLVDASVVLLGGIGPAVADLFFVSINALLSFTEAGVDLVRALFGTVAVTAQNTGRALLNFFRELNLATTQLLQGQGEAAIETADQAQAVLTGQLAGLGTTFARTFKSQMKELDGEDLIPQLENPFKDAGADLSVAMNDAFFDGLNVDLATGLLDEILIRADEVSQAAAKAKSDAAAAMAAEEAAAAASLSAAIPTPDEDPAKSPFSPAALELLQAIQGPQKQFQETQAALNELLDAGAISAEEYALALNEAKIAVNVLGSSASTGLAAGLAQIQNEVADLGGAIHGTLVNAFHAAEESLVQFVKTGELNFSQLVDSILSDLTRLLFRQGINALFGGGGGFLSGLFDFGGGKAEGGPVKKGVTYAVGEEGVELFTPESAGTITPAGETAALMQQGQKAPNVSVTAPPAKVQVVNVRDESEIPRGIESPSGVQSVLNVLSAHKRQANGALGR